MEYKGKYNYIEWLTGDKNPFDTSKIPSYYDLTEKNLRFLRDSSCSIPKSKRVKDVLNKVALEIGIKDITSKRVTAAAEAITEIRGRTVLIGTDNLWLPQNILSSDSPDQLRPPRKLQPICTLDCLVKYICERDGLEVPTPFAFGLAVPNEIIQKQSNEDKRIMLPGQLEITPETINFENGGVVITCSFEMACEMIWSRDKSANIYRPAIGEPIDEIIKECKTNNAIAVVEYEGGTEKEARDWMKILSQKKINLPVLIAEIVQSGKSLLDADYSAVWKFNGMSNTIGARANYDFISKEKGNIVKYAPSNRLIAA